MSSYIWAGLQTAKKYLCRFLKLTCLLRDWFLIIYVELACAEKLSVFQLLVLTQAVNTENQSVKPNDQSIYFHTDRMDEYSEIQSNLYRVAILWEMARAGQLLEVSRLNLRVFIIRLGK